MPDEHSHEIAHLRANGDWCSFSAVVVNPLDSLRTITILECACPVTIRLLTRITEPEAESRRGRTKVREEAPG